MRLIPLLALVAVGCGPDPAPINPGSPTDPVAGGPPGMGEEPPADPDPETATAPTPDPSPTDPSPSSETGVPSSMKGMLSAHNAVRARHCAPPLTWSADLARVAQRWVDKLVAADCAFDHSRGKYGENLAGATAGTLDAEGVVRMWYEEKEKYDFRKGAFSMETGHFTQVVWAATRRVGCATATCKRGLQLWVCNYDPAGNVHTMFGDNVKPAGCRR